MLEQFKAKFIEEAMALINDLEESLLDQEANAENSKNIQQIFRVMHTLKGVSSMYGFNHIGDIAHELESIFDLIRENKMELTDDIFDIVLKTVDHFRAILEDETLENKTNKKRQQTLLEAISKILNNTEQNYRKESKEIKEHREAAEGMQTFYIIFNPSENLIFRGVNILRLFEELVELGEYKIINHSFKEPGFDDETENAWGVYLVTDKGFDAIEDVFMFVQEDCRIVQVSDKNILNKKSFLSENQFEAIESEIEEDTSQTVEEEIKDDTAEEISLNNDETEKDSDTQVFKDVGRQLTSRISIDASKLDRLMYLVSELVTTKSQLNLAVETNDYNNLISIAEKIEDLSRNFRDNALDIRLVPVAEMVVPFKRLIRDLSKELGKEVKFTTQGIETELDKNVIDRLAEPILHILRNCVDHGIEMPEVRKTNNKTKFGTIKFTSFYSGANVFIQIQDDGAGIDPEKIKTKAIEKGIISSDEKLTEKEAYELLFMPGFSTAQQISEISGRGVGMDVVRRKINELRGEVEINSELGMGTFITIKLHQTLSIIDTLLLRVDDSHYLVPLSDVQFCDQMPHNELYKNQNRQVEFEEELIPFVSLRDLFKHENEYPVKEKMVIINKNDKRLAIVADKIVGEHQAVLKPLGGIFRSQEMLSGASMLGDGALALMLDTNKILNKTILEKVTA